MHTATGFQLRLATAADAPAIRRLIRLTHLNPLGLDWRRFTLAIDPANGQMIGCGQVKRHGDGTPELASIAVIPAWRQRGVARAIIQRLLDEHTTRSAGPIYLTCRAQLGSFYAQFGFRPTRPAEPLPAYFHWVRRLFPLLRRLSSVRNDLLIMVRE